MLIYKALSNVAEKTYTKAIEPGYKAYESSFGDKSSTAPSPISPAGANAGPPAPPYQARKPGFPRSPSANQVPAAPASATGASRPPPPPPLPARRLEKVSIPDEKTPINTSSPASATPTSATPTSKNTRPLLNRIMLAGEVVLTSLEATAHELINTGTAAASTAAG
jgi:spartin